MRRGETVPASVRADRSREATKQALARELAYAGILARFWPSYITEPLKPQPGFPFLPCRSVVTVPPMLGTPPVELYATTVAVAVALVDFSGLATGP